MKLQSKFISILVVGSLFVVMSIFIFSNIFIKNNYLKIEDELARKDIERVHSALTNYQDAIHILNKDWGYWDDTYKFVTDMNTAYIKSNLIEATYEQLHLNFIAFYDLNGKHKYGGFYDFKSKQLVSFPKDIEQYLVHEIKTASPQERKDGKTGIIKVNDKYLIVSLRPILKSDYTGPSRGTIVMGYYFDEADIAKLASSTNLELGFYSIANTRGTNSLHDAYGQLIRGIDPYIKPQNNQFLRSYTFIKDIDHRPIAIAQITEPRSIWLGGLNTIRFYSISVIISFIVVILLIWLLARKFIVSRLIKLSNIVNTITTRKQFDTRLTPIGKDELAQLVNSINSMLNVIQTDTAELENRVKLRTIELEKATEEMRIAKEGAELANRAKSIFLTNISHEIRTPMNAILGYTQLLSRDTNLTSSQRDFLDIINKSGDHLLALINNVLEMSKIESGKVALNKEPFDFYLLLTDVEKMFAQPAKDKNLYLTLEKTHNLPQYLIGDALKIRQVIINLINNAIKFTEQGGINVVASRVVDEFDKTFIKVTVADTGIGIREGEFDNIFNAFEKTQTGVAKGRGSGLGLTISRRYARLLGGDIQVTSKIGQGSVFAFTFQVEEVAGVGITPKQVQAPIATAIGIISSQKSPKIMIVDDNESNRTVIQILLTKIGFQTKLAATGQEAIEIFTQWQPELILMDLRLPDMNGAVVAQKIRELPDGKTTKILMLTASAFDDTKEAMLQFGIAAFIRKPYKEAELLEQIRKQLNLHYVYSEAPVVTSISQQTAEYQTQKIPPELIRQLVEATETGNITVLNRLIDKEVTAINVELANYLKQLAREFNYTKILAIFGVT